MTKLESMVCWYRIQFSNPEIPLLYISADHVDMESGWIAFRKQMPGRPKTLIFMGRCKDIIGVALMDKVISDKLNAGEKL